MDSITLPAPIHRHAPSRAKDGVKRHWIEVAVTDLKQSFSTDPNPREPLTNKGPYKRIRTSLLTPEDVGHTPGAFAYRHSGLTLVADRVTVKNGMATIDLGRSGGLLNGGHSQELFRQVLEDGHSPDEFVMLEILTGISDPLIPEIAEGRNTSLQVKRNSLADHRGAYEPIKKALGTDQALVIWHEGDDGVISADHIVAMLSAFDPIFDADQHPYMVYKKISDFTDQLESDPDRMKRILPIGADIVELFHTIVADADLWQGVSPDNPNGRKSGLPFLDHPKKPRAVPFVNKETDHPMKYAAALMLVAAFRYFTEPDPEGAMFGDYRALRWRDGFEEPLKLWKDHGHLLMRTLYDQMTNANRNVNTCARSAAAWAAIYNKLVVIDVTS